MILTSPKWPTPAARLRALSIRRRYLMAARVRACLALRTQLVRRIDVALLATTTDILAMEVENG